MTTIWTITATMGTTGGQQQWIFRCEKEAKNTVKILMGTGIVCHARITKESF